MDPKLLVSRLEAQGSSKEARALLAEHRGLIGLSQAFFDRVAELSAANPKAAIALSEHFPSVRDFGDSTGFALRARAVGERCKGLWLKSAGTFDSAGAACDDPAAKLSFRTGAIDSLARGGRPDEAIRLGKRLTRDLSKLGEESLVGRVLLNTGNAYLWKDDYARARLCFGKAALALLGSGFEREAASALMGQAGAELFGGSARAAREATLRAMEVFKRLGDEHFLLACRLNLAHEALLCGRADEALALLISLKAAMESGPDAARAEEFLGDAYLFLGLFEEAVSAFRSALRDRALAAMPLNRANCLYGEGLALLAQGDAVNAAKSLRRAASLYRKLGNPVWWAAALTSLGQAQQSLGMHRSAGVTLSAAVRHLETAGSDFHLALALLGHSDLDGAPSTVRRAGSLISRNGYKPLEWRVHFLAAKSATGPTRLRRFRSMFRSILEARMLTKSAVSRAAFLRDKADALAMYLGELLLKPTPQRVREALEVITRSRSAALLDEVLSATQRLPARAIEQLRALREAIAEETGPKLPGGPARRAHSLAPLHALQRQWIETTHALSAVTSPDYAPNEAAAVLAATDSGFCALSRNKVTRLDISPRDLEQSLKWLEFELLAPMVTRDTDPACVIQRLERLRTTLTRGWLHPGADVVALSPDGPLWTVPWQAVLNAGEDRVEPLLLASPAFGANAACTRLGGKPRCAIWARESDDLPHVKDEIGAFLRAFPGAELLSSLDDVQRAMEGADYDLLHVASHATLRRDNPMFSSIEFAGGAALAAEIARSSLRVRMVTLSACDTGKVSLLRRTEPDGLVRAFLATGAEAVIASSWPLDDLSASRMVGTLYAQLTSGETVAESLRAARLAERTIMPHPYFWAPFVLFSGYSR